MGKVKKLIFWLLVFSMVAVGIVFAFYNKTEVELNLVYDTIGPMPVAWLIVIAFILGLIAGILLSGLSRVKNKLKSKTRSHSSKEVATVE